MLQDFEMIISFLVWLSWIYIERTNCCRKLVFRDAHILKDSMVVMRSGSGDSKEGLRSFHEKVEESY